MIPTTALDLFAGIPVADYATALQWSERRLGAPPALFPNDTEAVWALAAHRYRYGVQQPEHAGHARLTLCVADVEAISAGIHARGLEPALEETYENGVRKTTYREAEGNEIGSGGVPV